MSRQPLVREGESQFSLGNTEEFARQEVMDAYVGDDRTPMDYETYFLPTFDPQDADNSVDSDLENVRLFMIIEGGMSRTSDSRQLTKQEAAERMEIIEHTWEEVRKWFWSHVDADDKREAATIRDGNDATPLHNACKLPNLPADVVQDLLGAAPETATWSDSHGWLPLHHACANGASEEVLRILCNAYPEGKTKQDIQLRTPLHFYLTQKAENPASMAVNLVFLSDSGAAELADTGGMLPMHYACAYGVTAPILAVLNDAYPEAIVATEKKGRTPIHLAMVNAHRASSPSVISYLMENATPKIINMRDHDGYLPLHLLALGLKGFKADEPEQRNNVSDCLKLYLGAHPQASADFLTALQDFPEWLQDVAVVSPHVRNILNKKIVQRFPTFVLMMDGYMLTLMIIFFEIASREHIDLRYEGGETEISAPLVITFIGATYFMCRELVQIISLWSLGSMSGWFYDPTNWLDITVIVLVYYYSTLMTNTNFGISNQSFRSGVAFTKGVLWSSVIFYLKSTLVDFAVFVGGVYYVLQRLAAFLLAVGIILLAFAQMFFIVYAETEICEPIAANSTGTCNFPHCTFENSLLKVYTMMMGEIGDETRYETSVVAQILYVAYAFLVVILLSNVLIAIVTDSYEVIQNDRAAIVFWSNRLDFVAEMDAIIYGLRHRIEEWGVKRVAASGAYGAPAEAQEGAALTNSPMADASNISGINQLNTQKNQRFSDGWKEVMQLFDQNLYDDIAFSPRNMEYWCYFFMQAAAVVFIIPMWILAGLVTAGILWPPQIREYLFVQKETSISRADLEKSKLEQLKEIKTSIKFLKVDLKREMASDRDEMIRMKIEVESIQHDVMSDLAQVKDLMSTLIDMGGG